MNLTWERHYTGIEIWNREWYPKSRWLQRLSVQLWLNRRQHDKRLNMARISGWRWALGIFPHELNYGACGSWVREGWEIFMAGLVDLHFGWASAGRGFKVHFSGSIREPYHAYTIRLGKFFFGSTTDKWIVRWLRRRDEREEAEFAAKEELFGEKEGEG